MHRGNRCVCVLSSSRIMSDWVKRGEGKPIIIQYQMLRTYESSGIQEL